MRTTLLKSAVAVVVVVAILWASGVAPAAYNLWMNGGAPLVRRSTVNFTGAGVTCVDNAGATRTDCTVVGGGAVGCATYTVASTNAAFVAAAATADVALFTLPQYGKIAGNTIKHSVVFGDGVGAMTDVSVSVGDAVAPYTQFASASSIGEATPVADTTLYDTDGFKSMTMAPAGGAVSAHFISTGRNFGDGANTFLTGGSVTIWACSARLQ